MLALKQIGPRQPVQKPVCHRGPIKFVELVLVVLVAPNSGAGFNSRLGFHFAFSLFDSVW